MVNYARIGRSQRKLWWRLEAVLTCKSIVEFGYRGERLIEPLSYWVVKREYLVLLSGRHCQICRGHPKDSTTKLGWKHLGGQVNHLGKVKRWSMSLWVKWIIRSQVLRSHSDYGCSSQTKWQWGRVALSYSRSTLRGVWRDKSK